MVPRARPQLPSLLFEAWILPLKGVCANLHSGAGSVGQLISAVKSSGNLLGDVWQSVVVVPGAGSAAQSPLWGLTSAPDACSCQPARHSRCLVCYQGGLYCASTEAAVVVPVFEPELRSNASAACRCADLHDRADLVREIVLELLGVEFLSCAGGSCLAL